MRRVVASVATRPSFAPITFVMSACIRAIPDGGRRGGPLRPPHRDAFRAARRALSCRSTGTSCEATTPARPGTTWVGTCPPTSASPSTCTRTSPTRSTSFRSRATPSTSRPRASCASIAAARAATSGKRSRTRPPPGALLRQRAAGRHVRRRTRAVRRLFRYDGWAGLRVRRRRRQLGADRARPAGRPVRRSADIAVIRVVLPPHLAHPRAGVGRGPGPTFRDR